MKRRDFFKFIGGAMGAALSPTMAYCAPNLAENFENRERGPVDYCWVRVTYSPDAGPQYFASRCGVVWMPLKDDRLHFECGDNVKSLCADVKLRLAKDMDWSGRTPIISRSMPRGDDFEFWIDAGDGGHATPLQYKAASVKQNNHADYTFEFDTPVEMEPWPS